MKNGAMPLLPRHLTNLGKLEALSVQVAALVLHYTELYECPHTSPPRSHTSLISRKGSP